MIAVVRKAVEGIDVVVIVRVGLIDDVFIKSFVDVIVNGLDNLCNLPTVVANRGLTVRDAFEPVLVPLTALIAGEIESVMVVLIVFDRVLIACSLPNNRSIVMGGKRVIGSRFCVLEFNVVAER